MHSDARPKAERSIPFEVGGDSEENRNAGQPSVFGLKIKAERQGFFERFSSNSAAAWPCDRNQLPRLALRQITNLNE